MYIIVSASEVPLCTALCMLLRFLCVKRCVCLSGSFLYSVVYASEVPLCTALCMLLRFLCLNR